MEWVNEAGLSTECHGLRERSGVQKRSSQSSRENRSEHVDVWSWMKMKLVCRRECHGLRERSGRPEEILAVVARESQRARRWMDLGSLDGRGERATESWVKLSQRWRCTRSYASLQKQKVLPKIFHIHIVIYSWFKYKRAYKTSIRHRYIRRLHRFQRRGIKKLLSRRATTQNSGQYSDNERAIL